MSRFDNLLQSPEFVDNPYPVYQRLRTEAPVYWSEAWGCWLVTRYDDVITVLRDPQRFSNVGRMTSVIRQEAPEALAEQIRPLLDHFSTGIINVDPPDHTRLRQLVHKAFTSRVVEKLRADVQQMVNGMLDKVQDRGKMDVVKDLAYPLPVTVISKLLGLPPETRDRVKQWSSSVIEFQATPRPTPAVLLRSQEALLNLRALVRQVGEQRLREPQDDLISALVTAEEKEEKLTEDELLSTCVTLVIGGHETTTNLITSGILALLEHPHQLQKLRNEPGLIETAVEEFLRYESPFQRNGRVAAQDVELDGQQIKKGQRLMPLLGAANRDPAQFADPDRLNIERDPNRHLAFGYGIHFCVGAPLARLEAPIAINTILRRMPDLRLEPQTIEWWAHVARGPKALHVSF